MSIRSAIGELRSAASLASGSAGEGEPAGLCRPPPATRCRSSRKPGVTRERWSSSKATVGVSSTPASTGSSFVGKAGPSRRVVLGVRRPTRLRVSRLATSGARPISAEIPLAASERGAGRAAGAGSAYPRKGNSRAADPTVTTTFRSPSSSASQWRKRGASAGLAPALLCSSDGHPPACGRSPARTRGQCRRRQLVRGSAQRRPRMARYVLACRQLPPREREAALRRQSARCVGARADDESARRRWSRYPRAAQGCWWRARDALGRSEGGLRKASLDCRRRCRRACRSSLTPVLAVGLVDRGRARGCLGFVESLTGPVRWSVARRAGAMRRSR